MFSLTLDSQITPARIMSAYRRPTEQQPVSGSGATDANAQIIKLLDRGLEAVMDLVQDQSQGTMLLPAPLVARDSIVELHTAVR